MMLFSFIMDIVDDHREIAEKYDADTRLKFFQRFCEWKSVGGKLGWNPKCGWGVLLRNWVRWMLEGEFLVSRRDAETSIGRSVIGCLLAHWRENDVDEEVMGNMLEILSVDFPNGPPNHDDNDPKHS